MAYRAVSKLLPRIYQIIEEINRRFIEEIKAKYPGNQEKIRKMRSSTTDR